MKIRDMFQKRIDRAIQGVVKIGQDDEAVIQNELDEYVVTKELNRHFDRFFKNYHKGTNARTDKIGVWISGFFGSGKSLFLKILSYLLSGKKYGGHPAAWYFEEKISDSRVKGDMKVAGDISADVILFNIDAKSDADSKINKDAIVKVFMKVFNEMQGFCGSMPWIADLERQMDAKGTYEAFKKKFAELTGSTWEQKREEFYFVGDAIVEALAATQSMNHEAAKNWYNKSESNYSLDIATFASKVREYIEMKSKQFGKNHFVVFLCDEMGQYMGTDNNILLNLQTVVENLGTECGGRAWVIATGQEDISSIVNETKTSRDDFSKIIGRFDTRLSLSSSNVDEVIKKRLLAKTEAASDTLRLLYDDKSAVIRNLITFSQGTPEKKIYSNADDFVDVYPFVPYHFKILQEVFTGIRTHGASGKHLSEGERSLLSAFQEAAIQYGDANTGALVPFDAFYRTIETFLDHNIRIVINNAAENSRLEPQDVGVLKVLFMVKYIADKFPANLENIATIMLRTIDEDKIDAKKRTDESLRRLESEKLIIKNGEQYIFLTNEEQDVNREIREISIDRSEIIEKVGDVILGALFDMNRKYRYSDRYDFAFNTIIDDRPRGNQKEEIGIRILTPYYLHSGLASRNNIGVEFMHEKNVIVDLPPDTAFMDEMENALQIDAYIRRNSGKTATEAIEDIKTTKIRESAQRKARCKDLVIEALKRANLYVGGDKLDIKEKAPIERVNDAFRTLVEGIFTKQDYINKPFVSAEDLRRVLLAADNEIKMFDREGDVPNALALEEMARVIQENYYKGVSVTARSLFDVFGKSPYGWKDNDIAGVLLTLFKKQTVRLEMGGESLSASDQNVVNLVTKRDYIDRVVVKTRVKIDSALLGNAKNLAQELFGTTNLPNDEDGMMLRFKELARNALSGDAESIKDLLAKYTPDKRYPGKPVLENGKKLLTELIGVNEVKSFFDTLRDRKDDLLGYGEDVQDVRKFFVNQKEIFDKGLEALQIYEKNRSYILDEATINAVKEIEDIAELEKPYKKIHKLPELTERFHKLFDALLEKERAPIESAIQSHHNAVKAEAEARNLVEQFGKRISDVFDGLRERLAQARSASDIIAMREESDRVRVRLIGDIEREYEKLHPRLPADIGGKDGKKTEATPPVKKTKTISAMALFSGTRQISSKDDISKLLSEVGAKLEEQLEENTTIKIV
jgi:hypothetical protein